MTLSVEFWCYHWWDLGGDMEGGVEVSLVGMEAISTERASVHIWIGQFFGIIGWGVGVWSFGVIDPVGGVDVERMGMTLGSVSEHHIQDTIFGKVHMEMFTAVFLAGKTALEMAAAKAEILSMVILLVGKFGEFTIDVAGVVGDDITWGRVEVVDGDITGDVYGYTQEVTADKAMGVHCMGEIVLDNILERDGAHTVCIPVGLNVSCAWWRMV